MSQSQATMEIHKQDVHMALVEKAIYRSRRFASTPPSLPNDRGEEARKLRRF